MILQELTVMIVFNNFCNIILNTFSMGNGLYHNDMTIVLQSHNFLKGYN